MQTIIVYWGSIGKKENGYILNAVLHLEVRCTDNQLSNCSHNRIISLIITGTLDKIGWL